MKGQIQTHQSKKILRDGEPKLPKLKKRRKGKDMCRKRESKQRRKDREKEKTN